jgi:hypothetical protein
MKWFLIGVFVVATALALSPVAQAQTQTQPPVPKQTQGQPPVPKKNGLLKRLPGTGTHIVEVNGQRLGAITLLPNGTNLITTLTTGHRVSLLMQNGVPTGAAAVDTLGRTLPAQVRADAVRRVIVIIIRSGGTTIIIVIRARVA